jgi:hypothetical protein
MLLQNILKGTSDTFIQKFFEKLKGKSPLEILEILKDHLNESRGT